MNLPAPSTQEEVARVLDVLAFGEIEIEGRLVDASNVALRGQLELDGIRTRVIYKPVQGERSLWDFPDGSLAAREAAAFVLSAVGGWNLVPPTVLREGPLGPGSVQLWVDAVERVSDIGDARLRRAGLVLELKRTGGDVEGEAAAVDVQGEARRRIGWQL